MLTAAALIWGVGFVAQKTGGGAAGPLTFSAARSILASLTLFPLVRFSEARAKISRAISPFSLPGMICGSLLCAMTTFQQIGMYLGTPSGRAGFITSTYIVIVPVIGIFIGKRAGAKIWGAVVLAIFGLWHLSSGGEELSFRLSDLVIFGSAICSSMHIYAVDKFSPSVGPFRLAFSQFCVSAMIVSTLSLAIEMPTYPSVGDWLSKLASPDAAVSVFYAAVMAGAVSYSLQNFGQNFVEPTLASLLYSLEAVFALLAGMLVLGESLTSREAIGCALVSIAVLLAILPAKQRRDRPV